MNHCVTARVLDLVVRHQEIAQEAERLLEVLFEWDRYLLPLIFELRELLRLHISEKQILEEIHWVETDAALVDGLKYL